MIPLWLSNSSKQSLSSVPQACPKPHPRLQSRSNLCLGQVCADSKEIDITIFVTGWERSISITKKVVLLTCDLFVDGIFQVGTNL